MKREDFLSKAVKIHGSQFDYTKSVIGGWHDKIVIICGIHGEFLQTPANHLSNKRGCQECTKLKLRLDQAKLSSEFVEESIAIRGNEFDYSKVDYVNNHTKVIIICKRHGEFLQSPDKHLMGQGCPKCRDENISVSQRDNVDNFVLKSNIVHNHKFNYDKVVYGKNAHQAVEIICPEHGSFWQTPTSHLSGKGCISCSHAISKPENEWLDSLGIPQTYRQVKLKINGKLIKPDAYDPNNNTIYEFYGDFWHGNPVIYDARAINGAVKKTFGELFLKTIEKENILKNAGYNLISIWENDWIKNNV